MTSISQQQQQHHPPPLSPGASSWRGESSRRPGGETEVLLESLGTGRTGVVDVGFALACSLIWCVLDFAFAFCRNFLFSLCVCVGVVVFPFWLRGLLLLAGDIDENPGPCGVCGGMLTRRNWQRCGGCDGEIHFGCMSEGGFPNSSNPMPRCRECARATSSSTHVDHRSGAGGAAEGEGW